MATGYVTDARFAAHTLNGHPEHAGRLAAVMGRLEADGLLKRCICLEAEPVDEEILRSVHTRQYLAHLEKTSHLASAAMLGLDTYVLPQSYEIARLAAGAALVAVESVLTGRVANSVALVRPPGHHATPAMGMGFCLLNNVALAARYAQRDYEIERVLIVDYDVHHGNGTQDIFYRDPSVLYISMHQSPLYPGTGMVYETGDGAGEGTTLNIPLPPGAGDKSFARVMEEIVMPAARRFAPELILISAGFDAHWADPLANLKLSLTGYDVLTRRLIALASEVCGGRIVFVMEGGYDLQVLSYAWANVVRALLGDETVADPIGPRLGTEPIITELIETIKQVHELP